ncbi:MAG: PqqD family protein [Candidatus Omnitrophica bacterium]|nr:PqqD family protein [Candidatus Omnitrophota bacterium]
MNILDSVFMRDPDIAWRKIDGDILAVNPRNNMIYPIEDVAARIWELIDGVKTCQAIADALTSEFDVDKDTAGKDIRSFIEELAGAGLIKRC